MQMKHLLALVFILVLIGFFPFACSKKEDSRHQKVDIAKVSKVDHFTNINNIFDSVNTQLNFDTIKNTDSLYIFITFDLKEIALNRFNFSLTNTAFADGASNTIELATKINNIELISDTTYNGNLRNTNLLNLITENGSALKDLMNTTTDFTKNVYLKINSKPTDVLKHQFTVRFIKENGDTVIARTKKITWLN
ncbi:MAG: hypothetical protein U0U67_08485 [Chitinophagales bacterium]